MMKLTAPNPEATLTAVRRLSEFAVTAPNGRKLCCKPFIAFKAPLARRVSALDDELPIRINGEEERQHNDHRLVPLLQRFRETNPVIFRTSEFVMFAHENGWTGENVKINAMLWKQNRQGGIQVAGKDGKFNNWRFK